MKTVQNNVIVSDRGVRYLGALPLCFLEKSLSCTKTRFVGCLVCTVCRRQGEIFNICFLLIGAIIYLFIFYLSSDANIKSKSLQQELKGKSNFLYNENPYWTDKIRDQKKKKKNNKNKP